MPTINMEFKPGSRIPHEKKMFLQELLGIEFVEKLEINGGRIRVSASYPLKATKKDKMDIVDEHFVERVKQIANDPDSLSATLERLSASQLKVLSRLLGQPVRSKASLVELRSNIKALVQAPGIWDRIIRIPQ